ncbi:MAG: YitT family protein [Hornefia sp.]|nr:YitT family protein [Hornefia sp.]
MKNSVINEVKKLAWITLGIVVSAFGIEAFAIPYRILIGGATGAGRVVSQLTSMSVSSCVLIINVVLLILAFIALGKRYAATIIFGSLVFPIVLGFFEQFPQIRHMVKDPLLATICAGCLLGFGIGVVIRVGGSMGGSDVVPIILNKKFNWPIAPMLYGIDVIILVSQSFVATSNEIVLGILMVMIYTIVANKILLMGSGQVQFMIFSPKYEEITKALIKADFGATVLDGKGAFRGEAQKVVVSVLSVRFMNLAKDLILSIDDHAFMTISSVREVNGLGFTIAVTDEKRAAK